MFFRKKERKKGKEKAIEEWWSFVIKGRMEGQYGENGAFHFQRSEIGGEVVKSITKETVSETNGFGD